MIRFELNKPGLKIRRALYIGKHKMIQIHCSRITPNRNSVAHFFHWCSKLILLITVLEIFSFNQLFSHHLSVKVNKGRQHWALTLQTKMQTNSIKISLAYKTNDM